MFNTSLLPLVIPTLRQTVPYTAIVPAIQRWFVERWSQISFLHYRNSRWKIPAALTSSKAGCGGCWGRIGYCATVLLYVESAVNYVVQALTVFPRSPWSSMAYRFGIGLQFIVSVCRWVANRCAVSSIMWHRLGAFIFTTTVLRSTVDVEQVNVNDWELLFIDPGNPYAVPRH